MTPTDKFVDAMRVMHGPFKQWPVENINPIRQATDAFADEVSHNLSPLVQEAVRAVLLKRVME